MSRPYTLAELAEHLGVSFAGDPDCRLHNLATLQGAREGHLSFIANPAYKKHLETTRASAVIIAPALADAFSGNKLLADNPYVAYARLTVLFDQRSVPVSGVHESAVVGPDCEIAADASVGPLAILGANVHIGAGAIIGAGASIGDGCVIGPGTRIEAKAVLYHNVRIGANGVIHSGAIIGADGFGFAPQSEGWLKIHQLGGVVMGDNVEIGACTTVDRGALDDTWIGDGVKIDNLVQIAHNCRIGKNTAIAGQSGIAGSTTVGENCTLAGQVGVVGHVTLADNVHITGMSLVSGSITEPGSYSSPTPLSPTKEWRKNAVRFRQLNELANRVKRLEKDRLR